MGISLRCSTIFPNFQVCGVTVTLLFSGDGTGGESIYGGQFPGKFEIGIEEDNKYNAD